MKCKNCGFEFVGKFCNMCGAPAEPQPTENAQAQNPYIVNTNRSQATAQPTAVPQNGAISIPTKQDNFANAPVPSQRGYTNNTAIPPQQDNFANAAVPPQQGYTNNTAIPPQQDNFANAAVPPQQGNFYNTPIPPQQGSFVNPQMGNIYAKMPTQNAPKNKSGKAGKIVLACIIGAIILAGIVIAIISSIANSMDSPKTDVINISDYNYDYNNYHINENAKTFFGNIMLTGYEFDTSIYTTEVYGKYTLTFKIENSSDNEQKVSFSDFNVTANSDINNNTFTNINDGNSPSSITINPHSTETFKIFRYSENYEDLLPIKITYKYSTADGKYGSIIFIKGGESSQADLFGEAKTDFGYAKITKITKPSESEIRKHFYEYEYVDAEFNASDYEDCNLYDFTLELCNNTEQQCTLREITDKYSLNSSDGISSEINHALVLTPSDYIYSTYVEDDGSLYHFINPKTTDTVHILVPVKKESDRFELNLSFSNSDTVKFNSSLDELEKNLSK